MNDTDDPGNHRIEEESSSKPQPPPKRRRPERIECLVLAGGGPVFIQTLASVEALEEAGFLRRDDIRALYGTSAGGLAAILLALGYDWETLRDYIFLRPWKHVFPITMNTVLASFANQGMFDETHFAKMLEPLLTAKGLTPEVTLQEFYEFSQKEVHLFAFELQAFAAVDLSHHTHPELSLVSALHMTCALPLLFQPVFAGDMCYIDGGIACNYPLTQALAKYEADRVLGFRNELGSPCVFDRGANLFEFGLNFVLRLLLSLNRDGQQPAIPHEVVSDLQLLTVDILKNAIGSADTRREIYALGKTLAQTFLAKYADESVASSCCSPPLIPVAGAY